MTDDGVSKAGRHSGRHKRATASRTEPNAPGHTAMVVDDAGLDGLVDELATQDCYGFDTEFHTERTYVPDLALIQIAWGDRWRWSTPWPSTRAPWRGSSRDRRWRWPMRPARTSTCCRPPAAPCPPGLRHPDRLGFPGHVDALTVPPGRPAARRTLPKADRLSDWLARPIPGSQVAYAVNDVAHLLELRAGADRPSRTAGPPRVGPRRVHAGAGGPHPSPRARGGLVEVGRHPQHVAPLAGRGPGGGGVARAHGRLGQPARAG